MHEEKLNQSTLTLKATFLKKKKGIIGTNLKISYA
jgi:hypothetical protein